VTAPIRILLVEDNAVFREALELLLGLSDEVEVVAAVGDGGEAASAVPRARARRRLMDYRLPGLDGVQATTAVREASPEVASSASPARRTAREVEALYEAGAAACLDEGSGAGDDRRHDPARGRTSVNLTADNTAIVLDSTADFPEAESRFPNWRVVPLYVTFGDESFRDGVDLDATAFYER
jgi:Response regulator containing a CheY-like receiver domain and an HTH DNA-binding domain